MITRQKYVLLKDVTGYTADHLLTAILDGNISAYTERPVNVPIPASNCIRYVRIKPLTGETGKSFIAKDDNNLLPMIIEYMTEDGKLIECKMGYIVPINELRVDIDEITEKEIVKTKLSTNNSKKRNRSINLNNQYEAFVFKTVDRAWKKLGRRPKAAETFDLLKKLCDPKKGETEYIDTVSIDDKELIFENRSEPYKYRWFESRHSESCVHIKSQISRK